MIYSKFGTPLSPLSKSEDASGRVSVQATANGSADVRDYPVTELKADAGSAEIERIVAELPPKAALSKPGKRVFVNPQARHIEPAPPPPPPKFKPRFRQGQRRRRS